MVGLQAMSLGRYQSISRGSIPEERRGACDQSHGEFGLYSSLEVVERSRIVVIFWCVKLNLERRFLVHFRVVRFLKQLPMKCWRIPKGGILFR